MARFSPSRLLILVVVFSLLTAILALTTIAAPKCTTYSCGYRDGYWQGHQDGFTDGRDQCKEIRRYHAYHSQSPYDQGYTAGYPKGTMPALR
jgi:hypothetical protein